MLQEWSELDFESSLSHEAHWGGFWPDTLWLVFLFLFFMRIAGEKEPGMYIPPRGFGRPEIGFSQRGRMAQLLIRELDEECGEKDS